MEFNTNLKIKDPNDYIGITPWVILGFGGSFIIVSLSNHGLFLNISTLIFLWGTISSFSRQIYKDKINFLKKNGEGNYDQIHKKLWHKYYFIQILLIIIFTILILHFIK